jgi:hypothetical protein
MAEVEEEVAVEQGAGALMRAQHTRALAAQYATETEQEIAALSQRWGAP